MNAQLKAEAWAIEQCDPDNWLEIPEFGIQPTDVDFKGFAYPIVTPSDSDQYFTRAIRRVVTSVRSEVRKRFKSFAHLNSSYVRVLDRMAKTTEEPMGWNLTSDEVLSFRYYTMMMYLKGCVHAHRSSKAKKSLLLLAFAAAELSELLEEKPISPEDCKAILKDRARQGGAAKMAKYSPARFFVMSEWIAHHIGYDDNKTAFAKHYARRVKNEFDIEISEKTIREVWLKDAPLASKPAR